MIQFYHMFYINYVLITKFKLWPTLFCSFFGGKDMNTSSSYELNSRVTSSLRKEKLRIPKPFCHIQTQKDYESKSRVESLQWFTVNISVFLVTLKAKLALNIMSCIPLAKTKWGLLSGYTLSLRLKDCRGHSSFIT